MSLPLNPAGFMLIGSDMKLNSPSSLVGQALTEILQHPERARDALRVLLHLVRERKKGNVATAGGPGVGVAARVVVRSCASVHDEWEEKHPDA